MVTFNQTVFSAIADPTRRAILDTLRTGEQSAGELASRFPISRPAVSRHLRVLRSAGLVYERKSAQSRYYALNSVPLQSVDKWLTAYRMFWSARLQNLKRIAEAQHAPNT